MFASSEIKEIWALVVKQTFVQIINIGGILKIGASKSPTS